MDSKTKELGKKELVFAYRNQAFNALMFIWQAFVSVEAKYIGSERASELIDLFKPVYDSISKDFIPAFNNEKH